MCNNGCRKSFATLIEMKEHINSEHRKNGPAHYSFSYLIVDTKDRGEKISTRNTIIYILRTGENKFPTDAIYT